MVSDLLRHFELATVLQIRRDPGRAEGMIANPHFDAGRFRAPAASFSRQVGGEVSKKFQQHWLVHLLLWSRITARHRYHFHKSVGNFQAVQEATGAPVKERLRSLKKQDLAAEAEKLVLPNTHLDRCWRPRL
jgi:hypothetical protein